MPTHVPSRQLPCHQTPYEPPTTLTHPLPLPSPPDHLSINQDPMNTQTKCLQIPHLNIEAGLAFHPLDLSQENLYTKKSLKHKQHKRGIRDSRLRESNKKRKSKTSDNYCFKSYFRYELLNFRDCILASMLRSKLFDF